MKHRRRLRRQTRRVAAAEEELLRESRILAERVLEPLRNMALYAQDIKKGCDGVVEQDDGFLFLVDDLGFDLEELKEAVDLLTREFRAIQVYKGQHDDLANQFQELTDAYRNPAPRR